jgi:hypothetical protein
MAATGAPAAIVHFGASADRATIRALVDPVAAAELAARVRRVIFLSAQHAWSQLVAQRERDAIKRPQGRRLRRKRFLRYLGRTRISWQRDDAETRRTTCAPHLFLPGALPMPTQAGLMSSCQAAAFAAVRYRRLFGRSIAALGVGVGDVALVAAAETGARRTSALAHGGEQSHGRTTRRPIVVVLGAGGSSLGFEVRRFWRGVSARRAVAR